VIKGITGVTVINNMYVIIPIAEAAIRHLTLLPLLSINIPMKGIISEDTRKGKAIAIPT